jgi:hypothetical protein
MGTRSKSPSRESIRYDYKSKPALQKGERRPTKLERLCNRKKRNRWGRRLELEFFHRRRIRAENEAARKREFLRAAARRATAGK